MSTAYIELRDLPACTTRLSRDAKTHRARYDFSSYHRMALIEMKWLDSLERYFNHGIEPGSFLRAVLENDLRGAIKRADLDKPTAVIYALVCLLQEGAPDWGWGSREKVTAFLASFAANREGGDG